MKKRIKRRILSVVLSAAMLLTSTPVYADVMAEPIDPEVGLCEHHTEHEEWCGYVAPTPGTPCGHEHDEACYSEVLACGLEEDVTATDGNSAHIHDDECYELEVDCHHEHDDECGYVEASAGAECEFTCAECIALEELGGEGEGVSPWVINDRFAVDGLCYKEIGPGKAQVYAVDEDTLDDVAGAIQIESEVTDPETLEEYTITSIAEGVFKDNDDIVSVTFAEEFEEDDAIFQITKIEDEMFAGCRNLTSVTYPNTVTSIGDSAFEGCKALTSIVLSEGIENVGEEAFKDCTSLIELTIPSTMEMITANVFVNCTSLETLVIANGVKKIEAGAFEGCKNLKAVNIPSSIEEFGERAFADCASLNDVELGADLESIGKGAFAGCSSLNRINLSGVKVVGPYAFAACTNLTDVLFGENLDTIGSYAFYNCEKYLSNYIQHIYSEHIDEYIGDTYVEYTCCAKYRLDLAGASNLIAIGDNAFLVDTLEDFSPCDIFTTVSSTNSKNLIINSSTTMGNVVVIDEEKRIAEWYNGVEISSPSDALIEYTTDNWNGYFEIKSEDDLTVELKYIEYNYNSYPYNQTLYVPDVIDGNDSDGNMRSYAVIGIADDFYKNSAVEWHWSSVVIADRIEYIGKNAFARCDALQEVSLHPYLQIGDGAFEGCTSLNQLSFAGLQEANVDDDNNSLMVTGLQIGAKAFKNCEQIYEVYFPRTNIWIGDNAFENCESLYSIYCDYSSDEYTLAIGDNAFVGCYSLTYVKLTPYTVEIGESAFEGCSCLCYIYLNPSYNLLSETSGLDKSSEFKLVVKERAFKDCSSLQEFIAYDELESIALGESAFEGCKSLRYVSMPFNLDVFSPRLFKNCESLEYVSFFNIDSNYPKWTRIGESAFEGCKVFLGWGSGSQRSYDNVEITIPPFVKSIGAKAFYGCEQITSIELCDAYDETTETYISKTIDEEAFADCTKLQFIEGYTLPEFSKGVFKGCNNLEGLWFSKYQEYIEENNRCICSIKIPPLESIFEDCSKLVFDGSTGWATIRMPDETTEIGAKAYKNCKKFETELVIPDSVTTIGKEAFYGCRNLKKVFAGSNIEVVGSNAFSRGVFITSDSSKVQLMLVASIDNNTIPETSWDGFADVEPGAIVTVDDGAMLTGDIGQNAEVTIPAGSSATINDTINLAKDATLYVSGSLALNGTITGPNEGYATIYIPDLSCVTGEGGVTGNINLITTLKSSMIQLPDVDEYAHSGEEIKPTPTVTVKFGGQTFVYIEDTDYEVTYSNNISTGTATVIVTVKDGGNLLGRTARKNFTIGKATPTVTASQPTIDKTNVTITAEVSGGVGSGYDGTMTIQVLQDNKVKLVKNIQMDGSSTSVEYTWNNLYNGNYTVKAIYNGDRYHTSATSANQVEFTINVAGNDAPLGTGGSGGSGGGGGGGGTGGGSTGGQAPAIPDPNANPNNSEPIDWGVITLDPVKGYVSSNYGIMARDSQDKHSTWKVDEISALIWGGNKDDYWQLQYPNGSVAKGSTSVDENGQPKENYLWEQVNGKWWVFDSKGYAKMGWVFDPNYQAWFYIHVKHGMMTGWIQIDNLWYYLHEVSDGRKGCMYAATRTPDGYYVREDGSWDGKAKQ